jgi:hypothetical protein
VHFADLVAAVVGLDVGEVHVAAVDLAARGRGRRGGAARGPAPPAAAAAGCPGRSGLRRGRLLRRWSRGGRASIATATATATAAGAGRGGVLEVDLLAELEAVQLVVPAAAAAAATGATGLHCGGDVSERGWVVLCWLWLWLWLGSPPLLSPPRGRKEREVAKERDSGARCCLKNKLPVLSHSASTVGV